MWQSLRKCELKLSAVLPPSLRSPAVPLQYLRLGNDPTGMDPTAGWVVQVDELKAQLPRYCRAAEPPHTATLFATQSFEGASPRKATSSKRLRGENGWEERQRKERKKEHQQNNQREMLIFNAIRDMATHLLA
eukprot:GHVT01043377.1.p2 GENE.GHVT01043377.1~~GHVT01043377.1.p2  ORF type:complete len:133 (-),score=33.54 GHVT01043377.1:2473-2871(-)